MEKKKLLEVVNLQTHFAGAEGTVRAVNGISFTLHRGETLGIVGESGSGKSVTSLSIMQLVRSPGKIVGGQIWYYPKEGERVNLLALSGKQMQHYRGNRLAMIFQEPMTSLNPVFRCGEQVVEALLQHTKQSKASAKSHTLNLFQQVKLPDPERIFRAFPHELSGGQKQRVMIAMAMCCEPDVLIADEPTTALDVTVQQRILQLMRELKSERETAIVFISHDLGVIAEIADQVIVMYKGQIMEAATVEQIFQSPRHPYTKSLLACRPPLEHRLRRLPVVSDFMEVQQTADGELQLQEKDQSLWGAYQQELIDPAQTKKRLEQLLAQKPLLRVQELETRFVGKRNWWGRPQNYVRAVDGVSFDLYPGETLGLVGESGCGKTTLGRSILRLAPVHAGQVFYKEQNLGQLSEPELRNMRKHIQIIFQDPYASLNPRKSIGEALVEPLLVHGIGGSKSERMDKVVNLLETVGLRSGFLNRFPHQLSGGERQRVCIARALAVEPEFIVCDECVSALDVSVQAQVLNLLLELQQQFRLSYIFISHDLSVVKFMSDRMMVMKDGKIVEMGPAEAIYQNPQTEYTRQLIAAIPVGGERL
ncbi:MAG: ABC transporter ATP-binding protein [Bacteroidota bacterium]